MTVHREEDWKPWNEELHRFVGRESQGFTIDLQALRTHILKLQELAPKDKAGWPVSQALRVIDSLQRDYSRFTRYLDQLH